MESQKFELDKSETVNQFLRLFWCGCYTFVLPKVFILIRLWRLLTQV